MIKKTAFKVLVGIVFGVLCFGVPPSPLFARQPRDEGAHSPHFHGIRHVLLISVDGMHSIDFANCEKGISGVNGGEPYCPNLASLAQNGVSYLQAFTPQPSDSFPGLTAQITGGTPRYLRSEIAGGRGDDLVAVGGQHVTELPQRRVHCRGAACGAVTHGFLLAPGAAAAAPWNRSSP